jgi:hypothetical protein
VIKVSPYSLPLDNIFEVFNEATTLFILTASMSYADYPCTPEASSSLGFSLIGVIAFNIGINMLYFLVEQVKFVSIKIREAKCIRDRFMGKSSTVPIAPEIPKENQADEAYMPEEEPT